LLVRDDAALFNISLGFAHGGEKCDLVRDISVIDIVWKPVDRLKNLFLNAHG